VEGLALPLHDAGVDVGVLRGVEVRAAVEGETSQVPARLFIRSKAALPSTAGLCASAAPATRTSRTAAIGT
jgi:hypothetical protein